MEFQVFMDYIGGDVFSVLNNILFRKYCRSCIKKNDNESVLPLDRILVAAVSQRCNDYSIFCI